MISNLGTGLLEKFARMSLLITLVMHGISSKVLGLYEILCYIRRETHDFVRYLNSLTGRQNIFRASVLFFYGS